MIAYDFVLFSLSISFCSVVVIGQWTGNMDSVNELI